MTPPVLADLGYTYELDGDKQQAADAYTRAANAKPKEIGYQLSAAQAQLRLGNLEETRTYLNRAAAIDPELLPAARHSRAAGQRREPVERCHRRIQRGHSRLCRREACPKGSSIPFNCA